MNRLANTVLSTALLALAAFAFMYAPAASAQSGPTRIINLQNNLCLDIDISTNVIVKTCNGANTQQWVRTLGIYGYQIRNNWTNRCLYINSVNRAATATCNGSQVQGWRRNFANVNSVFYTNATRPALCLDGSTSAVYVRYCAGTAIQAWR